MAIEDNKILVTGGSGMVGHALKKVLPHAFYPTRKELDLLNEEATNTYLNKNNTIKDINLDKLIYSFPTISIFALQ